MDKRAQLLETLRQHRAIFECEARKQYGAATIQQAIKTKYICRTATPVGSVLSLAYKGRRCVGLCGAYHPTLAALMNAAALWQVVTHLRQKGYDIEEAPHRSAVQARNGHESFVVVARYTGFDRATIKRMFERFVQGGHTTQLRVYVAPEKIAPLQGPNPRGNIQILPLP